MRSGSTLPEHGENMEWITIWTALGSAAAVMAIIGAVMGVVRRSDRASIDERFGSFEKEMTAVNTQIVEMVHKDEVRRIEARFEKDIADLRTDQKTGFAEIRQDIKDMRTDLMMAIKDAIK